jgi:ABC-type uncharacterized transport system permease subunit
MIFSAGFTMASRYGTFLSFFLIDCKKKLAFSVATIGRIISLLLLTIVQISLWKYVGFKGDSQFAIHYFALVAFIRPIYDLHVERSVEELHQSGRLIYDIVRPRSIIATLFLRSTASSLTSLITVSIPTAVVVAVIYGASFTAIHTVPLFVISLILGYIVMWFLAFCVGCSVFVLKDANGLLSAYNFLVLFFAGAIIPIDALPSPIKSIFLVLPFRSGFDIPIRIAKSATLAESGMLLAMQAVCAIALIATAYVVQRACLRRVEIFGG